MDLSPCPPCPLYVRCYFCLFSAGLLPLSFCCPVLMFYHYLCRIYCSSFHFEQINSLMPLLCVIAFIPLPGVLVFPFSLPCLPLLLLTQSGFLLYCRLCRVCRCFYSLFPIYCFFRFLYRVYHCHYSLFPVSLFHCL